MERGYIRLLEAVLLQAVSDFLSERNEKAKEQIIEDLETNELLNTWIPELVGSTVKKLSESSYSDIIRYRDNLRTATALN